MPCTGQKVIFCGIPHHPRACVAGCWRQSSHPCTQLYSPCGCWDGTRSKHDSLGGASGGVPAVPDVIPSPAPRGHRTWIIDVTIRGAQRQSCVPSPSLVGVAEAVKISVWAEPQAGREELMFRPICFDTMGGFGPSTLSFVRDVATARAKQLGAERKEMEGWVHVYKVCLSVTIQQAPGKCPIQCTRPLHLRTPLTLFPTPLYSPLHTLLDSLFWPRLPLDEDVPGDTQGLEDYDMGAALLSAFRSRGNREHSKQ